MSQPQKYVFQVASSKPPVIEIDAPNMAFYVRFKKAKVERTIPRHCPDAVLNIDLDASGEVVGIEGVGFNNFSIQAILKMANVTAPNVDLKNAPIRWAGTPVVAS